MEREKSTTLSRKKGSQASKKSFGNRSTEQEKEGKQWGNQGTKVRSEGKGTNRKQRKGGGGKGRAKKQTDQTACLEKITTQKGRIGEERDRDTARQGQGSVKEKARNNTKGSKKKSNRVMFFQMCGHGPRGNDKLGGKNTPWMDTSSIGKTEKERACGLRKSTWEGRV